MDKDVSGFVTIDPSQIKAPLKGYYAKFLKESVFSNVEPLSAEFKMTDYLYGKISTTTKFSVAVWAQADGESSAILIGLPENDYTTNVYKPYLSLGPSEIFSDVSVYTPTEGNKANTSFAYIDGYLVMTDSRETMKTIAKNYKKNPLSKSKNFTKMKQGLLANSAMNLFINDFSALETSELFDSTFSSVSISIQQTASSFKIKAYAVPDAKMASNYMQNGVLSLYKYMPKEKPLLFLDVLMGKNVIAHIKANTEYKEFAKKYAINTDTLLSIFKKEVALSINDNGNIYPAITFLADLGSDSKNINKEIDRLSTAVWEGLLSAAGKELTDNQLVLDDGDMKVTITKNTAQVGGNSMNQYEFEISQSKLQSSGFTLTIGTTKDNVLLVSTDENIQSTYKGGLQNNAEIKALISNKTSEVGYINVSNINGYIQKVMSAFNQNNIKTALNNLLKPWKSISFTAETSNNTLLVNYEVKLDLIQAISSIADYKEIIQKEFGAF